MIFGGLDFSGKASSRPDSFAFLLLRALQVRVDAVAEILSSEEARVAERLLKLREMLKGLPDLARGLCRIQYGKVRSHGQPQLQCSSMSS